MLWEYPWVFLAWLLLPIWLWLRWRGWGKPAVLAYPEAGSVQGAFQGGRRPGTGWTLWLRLGVMVLLLLGAARPRWVHPEEPLRASGLDILLALDMSGSMSARDFEPLNRLQAAKTVLREFITAEHDNRLGLVAFAARAYTVCPLTLDYQVLLGLLDHLEIGMTTDGTAIGMALAACLNRLKNSAAQSKVIILLTDGRNNSGSLDPVTAAQMAAALGVRIYTVGMGRPGGGAIVIKSVVHGDEVLLNPDGSVHTEALDETMLQKLSELSHGRYFRATDKNKLKAIYREISTLERSRLQSKTFQRKEDFGQFFLLAALLLLIVEWLATLTWEKRIP
ncbi:MAG: VWA domain-containing protein [Candidatus Firestonebacteria bacterium]|nr:VWA domain-containing protein [Candidatus Firestonebacteria bacterium]